MRLTKISSIRNSGFGLMALLVSLPLIYAQRPQPADRRDTTTKGEPTPRGEPARAPGEERSSAFVDRSNHGSLRHIDTHVVERPVIVHHDVDVHPRIIVHHDMDVDVHRPRFWHGFVYGTRLHSLRVGYVRIFVNNAPFYYDDGIYYQHAGDDYQAVYPPVGALVPQLPDGAIEIYAGNLVYYYAGGAFYVQQDSGFVIAPTPLGVIVPELPPGTVQVSVNNGVVYQFNGIYYRPVFADGVTQYMTFRP